ncbi:MAG TPA: tetratricopeptide repeat protein, partial [Chitinispirillaceae bacterium]|nr:tetratricopeptide repeat protein [Chitinispirillaceae bacterium]
EMTVLPEPGSVDEDGKDTGEPEDAPGFRYEMEKIFTGEEPVTDETPAPAGSVPEKEPATEIAKDDREEVAIEPEPVESSYSIPDHVLTPTLADIYYQQGQYALAVQIYTRLLDRDPDNGKLRRRLEEVKQAMLINGAAAPEVKPQKPSRTSVKGKTGSEKRMMHSSGRTSGKKKSTGDKRPLAGVRIKKNKKSSRGKKA